MNSYCYKLDDKCGKGLMLTAKKLESLGAVSITQRDNTISFNSSEDYKKLERSILSSDSDLSIINPYHEYITLAKVDCALCAASVENALKKDRFIADAAFDWQRGTLRVLTSHDLDQIKKIAKEAEDEIEFSDRKLTYQRLYFNKKGSKELREIERFLLSEELAQESRVEKKSIVILTSEDKGKIKRKIESSFSGAKARENRLPVTLDEIRILASILLIALSFILKLPYIALGAFLISGYDVIYRAFRNLFRGKLFDENFLMALATIGAIAIRAFDEAAFVMVLYQIGECFQHRASEKSRESISDILDINEEKALIERDGSYIEVKSESVKVGSTVVIKPGKRVPIDGIVIQGNGYVDTKAITGEPAPKKIGVGSKVLSGYINGNTLLKIETVERYEDSAASKIARLLNEGEKKRAKSERFITKFSRWYTPIISLSALMLFLIPTLLKITFWKDSLYRACSLLVISCPCALILSVPLSYFSAMGCFAKRGIIVKSDEVISEIASIDSVLTDKTGTITKGTFSVSYIEKLSSMDKNEILALAASLEKNSTHPIASAILSSYSGELYEAKNQREIPGFGLEGEINGKMYSIGRERDPKIGQERGPATICTLYSSNLPIGRIYLSDTLKENAEEALYELKREGIKNLYLLSGDSAQSVEATIEKLPYTKAFSSLLPEDKTEIIQGLREKGERVMYVGDGINDGPSLVEANVGVSMGKIGSDLAIEKSDVVITDDSLSKLSTLFKISKKTRRVVYENIVFSIGIKLLVFLLAILGFANMYLAILADTGVAIIAVLNALRCLYIRK